jgi:signal transduction histidine kinase
MRLVQTLSIVAPIVLFASLVTLATVTTVVQFEGRNLRQQIAEVEPARELARQVQLTVALEVSALHGFALTHNEEFLRSFERSRADEEQSLAALGQLAPRFGGDVAERVAHLRELSRRWHGTVPRVDLPRAGQTRPPLELAESRQDLYAEVIVEANTIQDLLTREAAERRRQIDSAEWLDWRATLLFTFLALVTGVVILWLGHRVQLLAQESERRRQELERLMESKARLMRGLSHDIRNPLGVVVGYSELLEEGLAGQLEVRQHDIVKRMHRAVGRALSMLDDLLVYSQAEAGTLSIQKKVVDAVLLLEEIVADYKAQASHAGLELQAHLPVAPLPVTTDAVRARQILGNLLSNAIKYTPAPGTVALSAAVRKRAQTAGQWLSLEVRDSGPGIPEGQREKIFEEFYRMADGAQTAKGFGVGLSMSRRIARLLGGEITVESGLEKGAAFTLWLPLAEADTTTVRSAAD